MEKKRRWAVIGSFGRKGRISMSQLLASRQLTRDEAVAMAGEEIMDQFDRELEAAGDRLQRVGEPEYLTQAGKVLVKVELTNSFVYHDTYELSDDGLRYLRARINYVAADIFHDCNDQFAV